MSGSARKAARLGLGAKLGYAVGDVAFNLLFTFSSLFLLYYYTDVLGLSPTLGGTIIMVALVWEGLTDPLMGVLANRTRSRFGRYRPYLLYAAPALCLSFVAMFVPTGLTGAALVAYAFAAHLLFRTLYTVVGIPYTALSAQLTNDAIQRSHLAGGRMVFAMLTGLGLSAATLPLVKQFGGGVQGFFALSLIYAGIALGVFWLCFSATREAGTDLDAPHPSVRDMLRMIRANRPFQLLLGATVLGSVGGTMGQKALVYYMKYNAGSEAALTTALTISLAAAATGVFVWMAVTRRTSKRVVWLSGVAITVTATGLFYLTGPGAQPLLWLLVAMIGFGNAAGYLSFWSMIPDTVEYGEWKTGTRAEGALYGCFALTQKVALGLGTGLIGVLLDAIGYRANHVQASATLHGIRTLVTLVPMTLGLGAAALISFYPLDQRLHARLVRTMSRRSGARTAQEKVIGL